MGTDKRSWRQRRRAFSRCTSVFGEIIWNTWSRRWRRLGTTAPPQLILDSLFLAA